MINQVIIEALNFLSDDFNLSTHGSVAVLLAAALYQGISDSNHGFCNIDIYYICRCCWNVATYKWKFTIRKWN